MRHKGERGQTILEAAIILPIFIFVLLGLADMEWALSKTSSLEYVVNETARCMAISGVPCTAPKTPEIYARSLAKNLTLQAPQFLIGSTGCDPIAGLCTAVMSYHYKPLGVYFPNVTIQRTGTASMPTGLPPPG